MKIPESVTKAIAPAVLSVKKHSPHILFVGGLAGVVTSTVLACRATLKVSDTLDEIKDDIDGIKRDALKPYLSHRHAPEVDTRRDIAFAYAHGGLALAKLYAPAVIIGGASVAALTGSHIQMTRRNSALTAAYVALEKAFNEYRDRVRAEVGEERETELYHNGKFKTVQNEDGTESKILELDGGDGALYSRVFDESNRNWYPNAETNRLFLEAQQRYFNDELRTKGFVLLNDVYHNLGYERTSYGAITGWVYGNDKGGKGFIDFGVYECSNADFVINGDRSVLLNFDVDGVIYHLI